MKEARYMRPISTAITRLSMAPVELFALLFLTIWMAPSVIYPPAGQAQSSVERLATQASTKRSALTLSAVRNCRYKCDQHDGTIKLKDGKAEGKFAGSTIFGWQCQVEKVALGDLDGDGNGDAVMAIGYNGGGSGYFVDLVAMMNKSGQPSQGATLSLGDRVIVKSLKLAGGKVTLTMMEHGPGDSMADTSIRTVQTFKLNKASWQKVK